MPLNFTNTRVIRKFGNWQGAYPLRSTKASRVTIKPSRLIGAADPLYPQLLRANVFPEANIFGRAIVNKPGIYPYGSAAGTTPVTSTSLKAGSYKRARIKGKGVSKRKQAALWGRYVPCDGITNASNTSIDTGVYAQDNIEMFCRVKAVSGSFYLLQSRERDGAPIYGITGSQTNNTIIFFYVTSDITRTAGHIYTIKGTYNNGAVTLYVKDETTGEEDTKTGTDTTYTFPSNTTIKLFGDANKLSASATVYRAYIKVNGEMKWDMYPAVDVVDGNKVVAYDDVAHAASTVKSGSITAGSLIQPISYAESTGSSNYFNTLAIPNGQAIDVTLVFKRVTTGRAFLYGCRDRASSGTSQNITSYFDADGGLTARNGDFGPGFTIVANQFNTVRYYNDGVNKNEVYVNGVKTGSTEKSFDTADGISNFIIGGVNTTAIAGEINVSPPHTDTTQFAEVMLKWQGVDIHYIPVRVGTTVELLDLVNWTYATRTGTFTAGADIPYTELCPDILETNVGDALYGQWGKNKFNRPDGSYSSTDRGSVSVSNQVITVNYQWSTAWSIYKLSGTVNSNSIAASLAQMKSQSDTDVLFESGKTYIVKLFNSTTDYYDLQISNTETNMQIADGVAFTPTEDFTTLWVRTQESSQTAGSHTFKVMLVEDTTAPTEYEPYHFGLHPSGEQKVVMGEQGVVDLGTLSWIYQTDGTYPVFRATINAPSVSSGAPPIFTTAYSVYASVTTATFLKTNLLDETMVYQASSGTNQVMVQDSHFTSVAEFKSAMSGKYLFYQRTDDASFIPPQTRTITTFLPSATSFIDTQKPSNNVECDWAFKVLDGTENWQPFGTSFYTKFADLKSVTTDRNGYCSHFEFSNSTAYPGNGEFIYNASPANGNVSFTKSDIADVTAWKAWLASEYAKGTPVIVCYPLATPAKSTVTLSEFTQPLGTVTILNEFDDGTKGAVDFYGVNIQIDTPAPKPDEPYPLLSNAGEVKYGQYGKNLYNKNNRTRIYGYFASSGTTWSYNASAYCNKLPCKPNTTYTARYNGNSTQAVLGFGSCSTDEEPSASTGNVTVTQAIRQNSPTIDTPVTITTGANDKWLIVAYNVAEPQHTDMADNLQIEEGPTASPYEPYTVGWHGDGEQTVKMESVNLFDKDRDNICINGFVSNAGAFSGSMAYLPKSSYATTTAMVSLIFPVESGKTYWIDRGDLTTSAAYRLLFTTGLPTTENIVGSFIKESTSADAYQITIPEGATYVVLYIRHANDSYTLQDRLNVVMFTEGTTAPTAYSPYAAPQTRTTSEILPSATSKLNMQGGNDNKDCDWAFKQLDGTENWYSFQGSFYFNLTDLKQMTTDRAGCCTHFKFSTQSTPGDGEFIFNATPTNGNVSFKKADITDMTTWKAWVAENKPILAYPVATSLKSTVQTIPFDIPKKTTYVLSSQAVDGQALDVQAMCVSE